VPSYNGVKSNIQLYPNPLNSHDILEFSYYSFGGDKYYTTTVNFDTMPLLSGYMNSVVVHWQRYTTPEQTTPKPTTPEQTTPEPTSTINP